MPSFKSDIKIRIESGDRSFTLNCSRGLFGKYRIKLGRTRSEKMPLATLTEIFDLARKWAVKQENNNNSCAI